MRMTRPKPKDEDQAALWKKLIAGEMAIPQTWEVELSKGGDKKTAWESLLKENKLGGLAMLRNIRNMREAGVSPDSIATGIVNINIGKLLPINFISAAKHNPQFEAQIEVKFMNCFLGKPKVEGPTIILIDVSGSMDEKLSGRSELKRIDVACSLAMIGRETFSDVRIFTFSNSLVEVPARHGFALRDAIITSQPHSSTQLGEAVKLMPENCRLIVITDEQSHDSVPQRSGYMINVASNKNGVGYGRWLHVDGWSDKVLDYIIRYEAGRTTETR